jgi:hypothetical protein
VQAAGSGSWVLALRLLGESPVTAVASWFAAAHPLSGSFLLGFGFGGFGRHGFGGGTVGIVIVIVLIGLRLYMRTRGGGGGPRGRGPWF